MLDYVTWNHPTSAVLTSLIDANLEIQQFEEYDWSPYARFQHNEEFEKGKYRIPQYGNKIPHVYSLTAVKKES